MSKRQRRFYEYTVDVSGTITTTFTTKLNVPADNAEEAAKLVRREIRRQTVDPLDPKVSVGQFKVIKVRAESITRVRG